MEPHPHGVHIKELNKYGLGMQRIAIAGDILNKPQTNSITRYSAKEAWTCMQQKHEMKQEPAYLNA